MSSSIMDLIQGPLGQVLASQMGAQLGGDQKSTNKAVAVAIPMLVQALARNAADKKGAESLNGALERDHDGSLLENLTGFLGGGSASQSGMGEGILGHVFGAERPVVENQISKASGLDAAKVASLLAMLAPIVMSALGKAKRQNNLDAGGVADMLGREGARVQSPGLGGLGKMLDLDGDGQFMDDVAKMGSSLLGGLFGGKR